MKKIIVTGMYRSGTTLIQKILDCHPNINLINHGVFSFFKILDSKYLNENIFLKDRLLGFYNYTQYDSYKTLFKNIYFNKIDTEIFLKGIHNEIKTDNKLGNPSHPTIEWFNLLKDIIKEGQAHEILDNIIKTINKYRKKNCNNIIYSGFKELNIEQFLESLVNEYGNNVKMVQVIRDPRSILASRNYSENFILTRGGRKLHSLYFIAQMWKTSIFYKYFLTNHYPETFLSIYYEDLVRDTDNEIKKICDFLSIDFMPKLLNYTNYKDEKGNNWKANTSFEQKKGFDTTSIQKWKNIIPKKVIGAFEFMCHHEMRIEGYCPITDKENMFKAFLKYEDENDKIKKWSFQFNLILDSEQKKKEILRNCLLTAK